MNCHSSKQIISFRHYTSFKFKAIITAVNDVIIFLTFARLKKDMLNSFSRILFVFLIAGSMLFAGCGGELSRIQKSSDTQLKYDAAIRYYKAADYLKALPLFEELLSIYRGTEKAQDLNYYYAYTNYYIGDYVLGQYYFTNYYRTYPHTPRAEECEFMRAFCEYLLSPAYALDQSDTKKAIDAFQTFADDYPNSDRIKECNKYIDILRGKLERKYFEIAKGYYITEYYHAASTALTNYLKAYPNSKYLEEANYLILKSDYLYATNSVEKQKAKRLQKVVEDYNSFILSYPKSDYLNDAESIYNKTLDVQKNPTHN
ncbi:MAG TPA: outer membrane protein assembly factor BamD [Bacteroidia bacterium]|jgi:outer membrane protein assembly factor BamD|nr:outer membrane protein assembly factor BamD [Bacteroidia bacterium]